MVMFSPGDRSEKIGIRLDSLIVSETWGEIWRATHDTRGRELIVAYKREEGRNLFLACRKAFEDWKRLAEGDTPGLLRIRKIVSSGTVPMVLLEDPGGETAREFFASDAATLKKTARMVRACARTVRRLQAQGLAPVGITPDTIFRKEGAEDYPAYLLPVTPGVFGDAVRLGNGRYMSPDALLRGEPAQVNADTYSLAWIWAELLARDHGLDHQPARLGDHVHYPRLRALIAKALEFRNGQYADPRKLETDAERWLENDATSDREEFERWAASQRQPRKKKKTEAVRPDAPPSSGKPAAEPPPADDEGFDPLLGDFGMDEGEIAAAGGFGAVDLGWEGEAAPPKPAGPKPPVPRPAVPRPAVARPAAAGSPDPAAAAPEPVAWDPPPVPPPPPRAPSSPKKAVPKPGFLSRVPPLVGMLLVFLLVSALSAGVWTLLQPSDSSDEPGASEVVAQATPLPAAGATPVAVPDSAEPGAEPVPAEPAPPPAPVAEPSLGSAPTEPTTTPTPVPPAPRPESVEALVAAFGSANESRDLAAIGRLYADQEEFKAVEAILSPLVKEDGEIAVLHFVPATVEPAAAATVQGLGVLRVTTAAFNLEIPVGRSGEEIFLTSAARAGVMWTPTPTPVPTEVPLQFAVLAAGEWAVAGEDGRIARFGLGDKARARMTIEAGSEAAGRPQIRAAVSNPSATKLFYQYSVVAVDETGRLLGAGSAQGEVDAGTDAGVAVAPLPMSPAALEQARRYVAIWHESETPLGLVGGAVVKNPRLPVGFARAHTFEIGEKGLLQARIYTDYIDNQKVIAAPAVLQNSTPATQQADYAIAVFDAEKNLIGAAGDSLEVAPGELQAFERAVIALPQSAYARVHAYEAVLFIDGREAGRQAADLPDGGAEATPPLAAAAPPATATATPTPLPPVPQPAGAAPAGAMAESLATVDEAIASMGTENAPPSGEAMGEGEEDYEDEYAGEDGSWDGESQEAEAPGLLRAFIALGWVFWLLGAIFGYLLPAVCYQKILQKSGKESEVGLAWVPGLNVVLVPWVISGRSFMYPALAFLTAPFPGALFLLPMWNDVCAVRGKSPFWAFTATFIPFIGVPYLAFSE